MVHGIPQPPPRVDLAKAICKPAVGALKFLQSWRRNAHARLLKVAHVFALAVIHVDGYWATNQYHDASPYSDCASPHFREPL